MFVTFRNNFTMVPMWVLVHPRLSHLLKWQPAMQVEGLASLMKLVRVLVLTSSIIPTVAKGFRALA
jgi:hypothetical protein